MGVEVVVDPQSLESMMMVQLSLSALSLNTQIKGSPKHIQNKAHSIVYFTTHKTNQGEKKKLYS